MSDTSILDGKYYSAEIDVLRCIAAVSVALFHFTWRNGDYPSAIWSWGWVGVEIFFVISGMVITASLKGTTPQQFAKARFLRLYPTAWICAVLSVWAIGSTGVLAYSSLGFYVQLSFGALAGSLLLIAPHWLSSAYWTLPIEIAFYLLVLAGLFWGFAREVRTLAVILLTVSTPYYLALAYAAARHLDVSWLEPSYGLENMALLRHGPYFALGIYLFCLTTRRAFSRTDGLLAGYALVLCVFQIVDRSFNLASSYVQPVNPLVLSVAAVAVFLSALALVLLASRFPARAGFLRAPKGLRVFGLATYPFYLLHEAVGGAFLSRMQDWGIGVEISIYLSVAATGAMAYGVVRLERFLRRTWAGSR